MFLRKKQTAFLKLQCYNNVPAKKTGRSLKNIKKNNQGYIFQFNIYKISAK